MHSVSDALTFACWSDGELVRRLSLAPDSGVTADYGPRSEFELPYWAGQHPVAYDRSWFDDEDEIPEYPLPFHPFELGELALRDFFGFILEGRRELDDIDPMEIHLTGYGLTPTRASLEQAAAIAATAGHMTHRTFMLPTSPPQPDIEPVLPGGGETELRGESETAR